MNEISPISAVPGSVTTYLDLNILNRISYKEDKIRSHVLRVFKCTTVGLNTYIHT